MASSIEEFIDQLTSLPDSDTIWKHTSDYANNRGYSGCSLVLGKSTPDGIQSPQIKSNFSEEFRNAYAKEGLGEIDPFLLFSCETLSAKKIVTKNLSSFPDASPVHQKFLEHAAENGAINNLGIPVRTSDSKGFFGGWIFSNCESDESYHRLEKDYAKETHLAAVLAFERMVAIGLGAKFHDCLLSIREKECLLWLCAGMRTSVIADKLSISNSAVNLYIANAKHKLGAKTREQAIARAIFSGEIIL
ncbi:MAG: LuxR C-terminal-related transcriptional regulator [Rhizobiaceae bacterium]